MTLAQDNYAQAFAERFPDLDVLELIEDPADLYDDPGAELLDIGDLGLTDTDELAETLTAPAGLFASSARIAMAADYEWATWLADVLRAGGVNVIEYPGWKTRGRPRSAGRFQPRGVLWHHDASTKGPSPYVAKFCAEQGRPDEGIPAPLSQTWVCAGCNGAHAVGTWHVLAAGRANHAGVGKGWGGIPKDAGNAALIGVETDHTKGEPFPAAMYSSLVKGTAAIMLKLRANPARMLAGHLEYAVGRKIDPTEITMSKGRADVAAAMAGKPKPTPGKPTPGKPTTKPKPVALQRFPGRDKFQLGKKSVYVTRLGEWLVKAGYSSHHDGNGYQPGPTFTKYDQANLQKFQRSRAALKGDADGFPGPVTWELLQRAAAAK